MSSFVGGVVCDGVDCKLGVCAQLIVDNPLMRFLLMEENGVNYTLVRILYYLYLLDYSVHTRLMLWGEKLKGTDCIETTNI